MPRRPRSRGPTGTSPGLEGRAQVLLRVILVGRVIDHAPCHGSERGPE